ncbi:DEAD/DEAH box helicase [Spirosoma pollinicola]|uniref:Restriction endonuclease n=1 Tax=Spirosoma pollinicola TaxID=2057025 RepID=A0A2K8Z7I1_9BACT|nr:DEAD/DEAH box helicase family protein [Spirosoma pollinicola]AUD05846.1 restriction endonuclease [Spirosoma pollinicola]
MELKPYQAGVIRDLDRYLHYVQQEQRYDVAYNRYWQDEVGDYDPLNNTGMRPYQNNVPGTPHVCVKVPTAGGKTFIAVNALHTLFNAFATDKPKAVVWLVPWSNLLDQTVRNLSNPAHPYRQKLNSLFNHRVAVYQKKDLLQGANFSPAVVQQQLSIFVLSFGSLRAKKKEDRKIFEENGALATFASQFESDDHLLADTDQTALINVIRSLTPVVVVDESHNAESDLSVDMLRDLNPSFVLDLTATPKKNANIVSFVSAIELKKEQMVKLPVIAYNHKEKSQVVESALNLQRQLERLAKVEQKAGGRYIRPIVLFQAQPKTGDDNTTFEKLKQQLLKLKIPEEQIKIKTADINELKDIDLMSPKCPVRYIITVNALKEGWDCPFAYILASLADRSSAVDIEQILGRVLRQPYVMRHQNDLLNVSYVLTASAKFTETLQSIIRGLESAGFSRNDYRSSDEQPVDAAPQTTAQALQGFLFPESSESASDEIEPEKIQFDPGDIADETPVEVLPTLAAITQIAVTKNQEFEQQINQQASDVPSPLFQELGDKVKKISINQDFAALAQQLALPQFYLAVPQTGLFSQGERVLLNQEVLLNGFRLADEDIKIDWNTVETDLYKIDIERTQGNQYRPVFLQLDNIQIKEAFVEYILTKPKAGQIKDLAHRMLQLIGNMYPIPDQQIKLYLERILSSFDAERLKDLLAREYTYRDKIKKKIRALADLHAEGQFEKLLVVGKISVEPNFTFRKTIVPGLLGKSLGKSLYAHEGSMNGFEERIISELAALPNVLFWHRNLGRGKGFAINGFKSNHYPDFIVYTQSGTLILLETKGDDRDNSDSAAKNRLGRTWAEQAGRQYKYFMVFDTHRLADTYTIAEVKELVKQL